MRFQREFSTFGIFPLSRSTEAVRFLPGKNMAMTAEYVETEPKRAEIDALEGATLLEFGSPWCGWCRRAEPLIAQALQKQPGVRHIKIADGSGRRLGRAF